ncbi:MAG: hypothetical protein IT562_07285, partial [Alphaproteobacteria bacterium]|nr:hypothetical protein [Alphaproteobacteria bacterium]
MADRPRKEPRLVAGTDGGADSIAFEREERPAKGASRRLRWLWVALALLGFTGAAVAAGWFALGMLTQRSEDGMARIYAPEGPVKVRPQQPGGMAVPDRDRTVYGRIDGTPPQPVERLLPGAEQPLPRPPSGTATVAPQPAAPLAAAPPTLRDEPAPAPAQNPPPARAAGELPMARVAVPPPPSAPPAQGAPAPGATASAPPPAS